MTETLKRLQGFEGVTQIYFPLELKFQDTHRQTLQGLELFKHIRLTTELNGFQFLPILLGYSYPLERLLRNSENTLLCSPATHLFHLKNIHEIKHSSFFKSTEQLNKQILKPYVLLNEIDEGKSEHDIRNEKGAEKLKREIENKTDSTFDLELWQKKIHFLQQEANLFSEKQKLTDEEFKKAIAGKKILYIDDEADKWKNDISKIFNGAKLEIKNNLNEIKSYFQSIEAKQNNILNNFRDEDEKISCDFKHEKDIFSILNSTLNINIKIEGLLNLFPYDLIILDLRLDRVKDNTLDFEMISGIKLLKSIKKINPFIPVLIFSASNKIHTYQRLISYGILNHWIKGVSSYSDLKKSIYRGLNFELPEKVINKKENITISRTITYVQHLYYKVLLVENRKQLYCISNLDHALIQTKTIEGYKLLRVKESLQYMLDFIQTAIYKVNDVSITDFWLNVGGLIEIRLPAFMEKSEHTKISTVENMYRGERNDKVHNKRGKDNLNFTLDYIEHSINFLLACR